MSRSKFLQFVKITIYGKCEFAGEIKIKIFTGEIMLIYPEVPIITNVLS